METEDGSVMMMVVVIVVVEMVDIHILKDNVMHQCRHAFHLILQLHHFHLSYFQPSPLTSVTLAAAADEGDESVGRHLTKVVKINDDVDF
jgi:hypothetical protein